MSEINSSLLDLPHRWNKETLPNERFLMLDSGALEDEERENKDDESDSGEAKQSESSHGRVLVSATRKNVELLCEST